MTDQPFDPMDHFNPEEDAWAVTELAYKLFCANEPSYDLLGIETPLIAVEIGVWAGATTIHLADLGYRVFAVDTWLGNPDDRLGRISLDVGAQTVFETFCRNMGNRLLRNVFPLRGTSKMWAGIWDGSVNLPIDFLFIDADHRYEPALADIEAWSHHVRPGGIVCGHDYYLKGIPGQTDFPGVVQAVQETGPFEVVGKSVWWRRKE